MRVISYASAINEAFHQLMETDEKVFLIGQGVTSPWYVGSTTAGLVDKFGKDRVIDTPVSENCITGTAVGAAIAGMRPVVVHPRMDFMYYAMDPLANHAANWHFMYGGRTGVPLVVWGIVNRGGEQAAQHSQSLQAIFAHIPGIKVVMPSTPYDAKGLLVSAVYDGNPIVYIDDRWLYNVSGDVPEELYKVPIGKGIVRRKGKDVTIVATSYLVRESLKASASLENEAIDAEVIDLRTVKPMDMDLIFESVKKTGRLVLVDGSWKTGGVTAEIAARIAESDLLKYLKSPVSRVSLPDAPAPASSVLENKYYKKAIDIERSVKHLMGI